jgi:glycerol kinase
MLSGLTRGTQNGHVARATLDAMALQNADILRVMQADVLGHRLIRPAVTETTVAGACYLAGLAVGVWKSPAEVKKNLAVGAGVRCAHESG